MCATKSSVTSIRIIFWSWEQLRGAPQERRECEPPGKARRAAHSHTWKTLDCTTISLNVKNLEESTLMTRAPYGAALDVSRTGDAMRQNGACQGWKSWAMFAYLRRQHAGYESAASEERRPEYRVEKCAE